MRAARKILVILTLVSATPLFAYTVYLRDGSKLIAKGPYTVEGDQVIITLQNGTRTSIAASEIDETRTRDANKNDYGSALVLEEGKFTEMPTESATTPAQRESLSQMIGGRESSVAARDPIRRPVREVEAAPTLTGELIDFQTLPRTPFRNLDMASDVRRIFRTLGVEQVLVSQGTSPDHLLIDITTNSEAAVFRGLQVAANALLQIQESYPDIAAVFELLLSTAERESAGQFVLTAGRASALAGGAVDPSTFFIENVRF